ncbi:hypothetical protein BD770DRAFT_381736 [Pilaira anomala]|nr:hypothetical protein BD770DRAFT_381736 [Pilaira anomala]
MGFMPTSVTLPEVAVHFSLLEFFAIQREVAGISGQAMAEIYNKMNHTKASKLFIQYISKLTFYKFIRDHFRKKSAKVCF